MRQLIGAPIELPIRQPIPVENKRRGVRRAFYLSLKKLMDTRVFGVVDLCVIPLNQ